MNIYVEIRIRTPLEDLWRYSQVPDLHQRWDLRFTDITYLPRPDERQPQRFRYATRIGFGLMIQGEGETVGSRSDAQGARASALKFWSEDPKSLIWEGSGYWKYIPTDDGIRFLTLYNYRVRYGMPGRVFDRFIFRPLLGWATAWSFDRLRLWLEQGLDPTISLQRSLVYGLARMSLAFVWLYHGAIPKLLYQHADETAMLRDAGMPIAAIPALLTCLGWGEIGFGVLMLMTWRLRWPFVASIVFMLLAIYGAALYSPAFLVAAFNPVTFNLLMMSLSLIGLLSSQDLPSARRCWRTNPESRA